jgi:hypothetical protein
MIADDAPATAPFASMDDDPMEEPRSKRARQPPASQVLPHTHGASLVGTAVSVYWDEDRAWYRGTIKEFDRVSGWHTVAYDDGEQRNEPLNDPRLQWRVAPSAPVEVEVEVEVEVDPPAPPARPAQPTALAQPTAPVDERVVPVVSVEALSDSESGEVDAVDAVEVTSGTAHFGFLAADDDPFEEGGSGSGVRGAEQGDDIYTVERVLAERGGRYLVRWAGCPPEQDTWEPRASFLDPTPIEAFLRARKEWEAHAQACAASAASAASAATATAGVTAGETSADGACDGALLATSSAAGASAAPLPGAVLPPLLMTSAEVARRPDGMYECPDCWRLFDKVHGLMVHRVRATPHRPLGRLIGLGLT